jgi:hypothetical protein
MPTKPYFYLAVTPLVGVNIIVRRCKALGMWLAIQLVLVKKEMSRISLVPFTVVSLPAIIVSKKEAKLKQKSQLLLLCFILEIAVMLLNARHKPEAV